MIIGRGLIATAFTNSPFDTPPYVVFASGVSNSTESDPVAYARELALLDAYLTKNTTLIYFSTTSIFDPTKTASLYIQHKTRIENRIREEAGSYILVRLPILVGRTPNPYTLINFLVNAIREKRPVELHTGACRHILDIDDLVVALLPYSGISGIRHTVNIPGSAKIPVPELVSKLEDVLGTKGVFTWNDSGACYDIPESAGETIYIREENYVDKVLAKYYS